MVLRAGFLMRFSRPPFAIICWAMFIMAGFCIMDAKSIPPGPPVSFRDRSTSSNPGPPAPPALGPPRDEVPAEVEDAGLDVIRERAFSFPFFRLALFGSRSSPFWKADAADS